MKDRLTKKDRNGKYYTVASEMGLCGKDVNPITNWIEDLEERNFGKPIDRLGKLEDLLDQYNIKDLEELDKLLTMATSYEELSKQIGCPLDVVFKALTNGFKFIISSHKLGTQNQIVNQMIYCDYAYLYYANDVNAWCISTINDYFYLKDYKKTWFLKEDKSE